MDYLTAKEAAALLDVSLPTLYAYVSRGQLGSEALPGEKAKRYRRSEVAALIRRRDQRGEPGPIAEAALSWGTPVLASAIALIQDGRLYYRGREAVALAEAGGFERVAAWLWTGEDDTFPEPAAGWAAGLVVPAGLDPLAACQAVLPVAAAADPAAADLRPQAVVRTGARIVRALGAIVAGAPTRGALAVQLAEAWGVPDAVHAIDAALILLADHELNVSTFAARCAASADATPYDAVLAGLATLRGARHGGHAARVAALFDEVGTPDASARVLAARLRRGETVPGFGQPLYPAGDPRCVALLAITRRSRPDLALAEAIATAGHDVLNEHPSIDFGLVAMARAFGLPADAPAALFALGRSAGWVAHAIEQYASGALIRPRARYVGPPPA